MKIKLHHLNLCSKDVAGMEAFYRTVLDLAPEPSLNSARDTTQGYAAPVAFVTDGQIQVHLATQDLGVGFRTRQFVNPLERGHIAFRTDDIAAFKRRLEEKNIPYSDYGQWAMNGWHQVFFYDPEGNVIEVHQDMRRSWCAAGDAGWGGSDLIGPGVIARGAAPSREGRGGKTSVRYLSSQTVARSWLT